MVKIEKAPAGAITSDKWNALVNGEALSIYIALCPDGKPYSMLPAYVQKEFDGCTYGGTTTVKTYFTSFCSNEKVKIEILCNNDASELKIKPESLNKKLEKTDNGIAFDILPNEYVTVEKNGDIFGALHIFCNDFYKKDENFENVIEFEKGYQTCENCSQISVNEHNVPVIDKISDNTLIYISDGAVVCAAIVLDGVKNVKICGNGIISLVERCNGSENGFAGDFFYGGRRKYALPNIFAKSGCENIEIEGVILNCEFRGIVLRNCKNVKIDKVKIFTSCVNSDAINTVNIADVNVKNSYIQCGDDCFATFTSQDDIDTLANNDYANPTKVSENIEIANCILSTNCRAFMIGGHGTSDDNPHNKIQNINVHDIEIINIANNLFIDDKVHSRYWSGIFRILSQSGQHIENIRFENINVNWTKGYNGKAFHIEIRSDETASYTEKAGYRINDVKFKNICFYHCPYNIEKALIENGITGDENARIENISFENVKYENAASFDLYEVNGESENIEITF